MGPLCRTDVGVAAMRSSSVRIGAALAVLGLGAGCLLDNPAFGSGGATEAGSGSAGGTAAATGAGSTGSTPTTSGSTSDAPTTSAGATGSTGAGSTGQVSSETGDSTGGGSVDCWALGNDAWTVEAVLLKGDEAGSPSLSPDGLSLYYRAKDGADFAVFRNQRASVADPFPVSGALFFSEMGLISLDYPRVHAGEDELFFMQGDPGDIYVAHKVADAWQASVIAGGFQLFGSDAESIPNITTGDDLLLFQRQDGPASGVLTETWNFYQAMRSPDLATFPDVAPAKVTPTGSFVAAVCPTLSPDGLHLFFGASDAEAQSKAELNDGRVGVWYGHRGDVGETSWQDIERSAVLRTPGVITCPTSVTADGCQMTTIQFVLDDGTYNVQLARRGG